MHDCCIVARARAVLTRASWRGTWSHSSIVDQPAPIAEMVVRGTIGTAVRLIGVYEVLAGPTRRNPPIVPAVISFLAPHLA